MISPRTLNENRDEKNAETSLQTLAEKRWIRSKRVRVKENLKWCVNENTDEKNAETSPSNPGSEKMDSERKS